MIPGYAADGSLEVSAVPGVSRDGAAEVLVIVDDGLVVPIWEPWERPLTEDEMRILVEATGWPEGEFDNAISTAHCESRLDPNQINVADQTDGLGSTGLWQLWSGWYRAAGLEYSQWMIPAVNATAARVAWETSGWWPWAARCRP